MAKDIMKLSLTYSCDLSLKKIFMWFVSLKKNYSCVLLKCLLVKYASSHEKLCVHHNMSMDWSDTCTLQSRPWGLPKAMCLMKKIKSNTHPSFKYKKNMFYLFSFLQETLVFFILLFSFLDINLILSNHSQFV